MNIDEFRTIIADGMQLPLPAYTRRDLVIPDIDGMSIAITGPRRSGKTIRTFQYIEELTKSGVSRENICRIQFNDHRINAVSARELDVIDRAYYSLYPSKKNTEKVWFVFDEIHRIDGWEDYILYLLDNPLHAVLITGSTSKLLSGDIASSLRGKNFPLSLFPFSFQEFLRHHQIPVDTVSSGGIANLRHYFDRYLRQGGFPGLLDLPEGMHLELLQTYWDTMILRDIIEAHPDENINIAAFTQFYKSLLSKVSRPMSVNRIVDEMRRLSFKFSAETIYRYLEHLKQAFLVYTVEIFSESEAVRAQNYKKVYCVDWALGNAVTPGMHKNLSRNLENLIFIELKRRGYAVSYFKTRQGYEVDFITVDRDASIELFQVCYDFSDDDVRKRELRALVNSARFFESTHNYVLTPDLEERLVFDNVEIKVLPMWKFLIVDS
jgi:uncharacterized protein